jgi:hypothetical protein
MSSAAPGIITHALEQKLGSLSRSLEPVGSHLLRRGRIATPIENTIKAVIMLRDRFDEEVQVWSPDPIS